MLTWIRTSRRMAQLLFGVMVLALGTAQPRDAAAQAFKPFALPSLDGSETRLADVLQTATLVVFFFPTCPYCKVSLPETQKLYDRYRDRGLSMVWINVVPQEDRLLADWRARHGFSVPVLRGGRSIQRDYRLKMTPTHYLLDDEGNVLFVQTGFSSGDEAALEDEIRRALAPR